MAISSPRVPQGPIMEKNRDVAGIQGSVEVFPTSPKGSLLCSGFGFIELGIQVGSHQVWPR